MLVVTMTITLSTDVSNNDDDIVTYVISAVNCDRDRFEEALIFRRELQRKQNLVKRISYNLELRVC